MKRYIALIVALLFAISPISYASVGVEEDGVPEGAATNLNFSTGLDVSGDATKTITVDNTETSFVGADLAGAQLDPEKKETTDQTVVLATESGKIFACTQNTKFQLPDAQDGLWYTFTAAANIEIEIQVSTTPDTIVNYKMDGDRAGGIIETIGTNTTGNTVTLVSDGTDWYITNQEGTWGEGGSWIQLNLGAQ